MTTVFQSWKEVPPDAGFIFIQQDGSKVSFTAEEFEALEAANAAVRANAANAVQTLYTTDKLPD
jgi:hypothetical protein